MTILPGEFWIAEIPFTGGVGSKKRPVLVLWLDEQDAVVAVVTSAKPRSLTDVELGDWGGSGLRVASTVRLSRLDCLERSLYWDELDESGLLMQLWLRRFGIHELNRSFRGRAIELGIF